MNLDLGLQATHDEQDALLEWAKARLPSLSLVERLRLDGSGERPGARLRLPGAEVETALSVEDGALVLEFEKVRAKLIGAVPLPRHAWAWKVRDLIAGMRETLPPGIILDLDAEARYLRVRVAGLAFRRVLILRERLALRLESL